LILRRGLSGWVDSQLCRLRTCSQTNLIIGHGNGLINSQLEVVIRHRLFVVGASRNPDGNAQPHSARYCRAAFTRMPRLAGREHAASDQQAETARKPSWGPPASI
jgi:hypothetical protein